MKKISKPIPKKTAIKKSVKGKIMSVFQSKEAESHDKPATAQPQPDAPAPKRAMTKAEAEEVLDRLHYCKKHGEKMEADEHGAWHCKTDDAEKAAAEEKEAQEAFKVLSAG